MGNLMWIVLLAISVLTLITLLFKHSKYRVSLKRITLHWILAAILLFVLHSIELTASFTVPITPLSISTIALLGLPGLALVQGIYILI